MIRFKCGFEKLGNLPDPVYLHEDDTCDIIEWDSLVTLSLKQKWNPNYIKLIHRFGVRGIEACDGDGWNDETIDFLKKIPDLRSVMISTSSELDLKPLEKLSELTSLWITSACALDLSPLERLPNLEELTLFLKSKEQSDFDFTRLRRLQTCKLDWIPQFQSVCKCTGLKSLWILWVRGISSDGYPELRELDLREMGNLEELTLEGLIDLKKIDLSEAARIRALRISQCRKLQVDLNRFVRDLECLQLEGKIAFPLDDLGLAKCLKIFQFMFLNNKLPIPPFISKLPRLIDGLAVDTKLSEPDRRVEAGFSANRRARNKQKEEETRSPKDRF